MITVPTVTVAQQISEPTPLLVEEKSDDNISQIVKCNLGSNNANLSEVNSPIKTESDETIYQPKEISQGVENNPLSKQGEAESNSDKKKTLTEAITRVCKVIFAMLNHSFVYVSELINYSVKCMVNVAFLSVNLIKDCNISVNFKVDIVHNHVQNPNLGEV
jgi:hypothetical protein